MKMTESISKADSPGGVQGPGSWANLAQRNLDRALAHVVAQNKETGKPEIRNAVVQVEVPQYGFVHTAAVGQANADSDAPMTPDHQFHLASVTKTMTATLVLQLWEQGALGERGLDATLAEMALFDDSIVERLHVLDGVNYGRQITVRHLLSHSSGMKGADIDDDTGTEADHGGLAPGSYAAQFRDGVEAHLACLADPDCDVSSLVTTRDWSPWDADRPFDKQAGLVNWYLNSGVATTPLFPPGEGFHYCDTGYIILSLLAEKLSGKSFHAQLRENIFDPLGMDRSYLAYAKDPEPASWEYAVAEFWMGDIPGITYGFNVSFDRGGGGVVTTAGELNRFLKALLNGELFEKPETMAEMIDWQAFPGTKGPQVGLGMFTEPTPFDTAAWGHSGLWGARMLYEPDTGTYLSGTVNQISASGAWWTEILQALHDARAGRETPPVERNDEHE